MKRVVTFAPLFILVILVIGALAVDAGRSDETKDSQTPIKGETYYDRSMELPGELLRGAIDLHVHAGPHLKSSPRRVDPIQAAEEAKAAGMRGLVYMDVIENSCGTAFLVSRTVPGIEVFGVTYDSPIVFQFMTGEF